MSAPSSGSWPELLVDSVCYAAAFGLAAAVLIGAAVLGFISPETRPDGQAWTPPGRAIGGPDPSVRGPPPPGVLDHEEPEVVDYVAQVMTYWLDRSAAGWRLDAAYAVPASFWAKVLPGVREAHPERGSSAR